MKRRNFLLTASGILGSAMIPELSSAQVRPCPPVLSGIPSECGSVPEWFSRLSHLEWTAPVTNWLGADGVRDPLADIGNALGGHQGIINAWTGMLADDARRTIAMLANGGHNDYAGNEVYSCDLGAEEPKWARRREATPSEGSTGSWYQWSDGTPGPTHTNNAQIAANGRWFLLGMTASCFLGFSDERWCWEYDPERNVWTKLGSSIGPTSSSFGTCSMFYPNGPDGGLLIRASHDYTAYQALNSPGELYELGGGTPGNGDALMGCVDTTHDVMLTWQKLGDNNYRWRKLVTSAERTSSSRVLTATGTPPSFKTAQIHWHEPSKAFLTWAGSGSQNLKKLTPTVDGDGNYIALEWSDVVGYGAATPSWSANDLMYNKINMIKDMGNGDAAFIVVPRYGNPDTYVMRIAGPV